MILFILIPILQYRFKKLNSLYLGRKNPILPFDDVQKMEWLSKKHDASLFAMTTHSKKRPDNFIFGKFRFYYFSFSEFIALASYSGYKLCNIMFLYYSYQLWNK